MCKSRVRALHANGNDDDLSDDDSFNDAWLAAVSKGLKKSKSTARLIVNDQEVRFTIDTGAEVNLICQKFVRKDQVRPVTQRLIMWNGTKMIPRGVVTLPVYNEKSKSTNDITFTVVKNELPCLLRL